jgi:hypothetical protein
VAFDAVGHRPGLGPDGSAVAVAVVGVVVEHSAPLVGAQFVAACPAVQEGVGVVAVERAERVQRDDRGAHDRR